MGHDYGNHSVNTSWDHRLYHVTTTFIVRIITFNLSL